VQKNCASSSKTAILPGPPKPKPATAISKPFKSKGVLLHFFLSDIAEAEEDPERITALADWNYWRRDLHDEMWEE